MNRQLHTANRLLKSAYCNLPTAFCLLLILLTNFSLFAGGIDSLKTYTYKQLEDKIYSTDDSLLLKLYTDHYLNKAKLKKDSLKIAYAFYLKDWNNYKFNDSNEDYSNYDSIIKYTDHIKGDEFFPSIAYFNKGKLYQRNEKYKEALENYLIAIDRLNTQDSTYYHHINYTIADLKIRFNKHFEGLNILKEIYGYHQRNRDIINNKFNQKLLLPVLFTISYSFSKQGLRDSAEYYTDMGYRISIQDKSPTYNYFVLAKGVQQYQRGSYQAAIDSIHHSLEGIKALGDMGNLSYGHHFLGLSYAKLGYQKKAIKYFKKVDSIFSIVKNVNPDIKEGFKHLIADAKSKKNLKDQLHYTNQILKLDSIYYTNYMSIHTGIYEKIDRERLEQEKRDLQKTVAGERKRILILNVVVGIVLIVVVFITIQARRRKKRFEMIYQELRKNERFELDMIEQPSLTSIIKEEKINEDEKTKKTNSELSDEFVQEILKKLDKFEERNEFLSNKVRLESLAKKLKTNSRYLSKIINSHKNKNFTQYINGLRVEYLVKELNKGSRYRKYTIEGIAEEIGFNNAESFSKAFHKKTGIYPSMFIKNLNKESKKSQEE